MYLGKPKGYYTLVYSVEVTTAQSVILTLFTKYILLALKYNYITMMKDSPRCPSTDKTFGASAYREDVCSFPDNTALHLASVASLKELNARIKSRGRSNVTMSRFRPNIIVDRLEVTEAAGSHANSTPPGLSPWAEDAWAQMSIIPGSPMSSLSEPVLLRKTYLASRCMVTKVDPATGIPNEDDEPIRTLSTYRLHDNKKAFEAPDPRFGDEPMFGLKLAMVPGSSEDGVSLEVSVGDVIMLMEEDKKCIAAPPPEDEKASGAIELSSEAWALIALIPMILVIAFASYYGHLGLVALKFKH